MIPYTIPQDHVILNLNHIVRIIEHPNAGDLASRGAKPYIEVLLSTGETLEFEDKAAEIIKGEVMFCFTHHQNIKAAIIQQTNAAAGGIIVPTMGKVQP